MRTFWIQVHPHAFQKHTREDGPTENLAPTHAIAEVLACGRVVTSRDGEREPDWTNSYPSLECLPGTVVRFGEAAL